MTNNSKHTALVLFTRSLQEESRAKDIFRSPKKGAILYKSLIDGVKAQVAHFDADFFEFGSQQQRGNSFSEKLNNAFEHFFNLGYKKVILVGNDCPTLHSSDFKKADQALLDTGLVIGPSNLGGVYLIGITKSFFESQIDFDRIAWNTEAVVTDLLQLYAGEIKLLKCQNELNSLKDIYSLVSQFSIYPLLKKIVSLFVKEARITKAISSFFIQLFYSLQGLRAPPIR